LGPYRQSHHNQSSHRQRYERQSFPHETFPRENQQAVSAPTLKADESENGLHPSARYSRIAAGFRGYDNEAMAVLEESVKEFAHSLGFSLCGIAPATAADGFDRLTDWLGRGFAGEMAYMHKQQEARRHAK